MPSGDLHIFRVEENDASASYSCRVRNTLTNNEENSPPFHLAVDSEYHFIFKTKDLTSKLFDELISFQTSKGQVMVLIYKMVAHNMLPTYEVK